VAGGVLPCGCLVGVYETWASGRVTILDEKGPRCLDARHVRNAVL
jgi:hypothetical protein